MSSRGDGEDIATKTISGSRKRLVLHLKKNSFGMFIKVAEYSAAHIAKLVVPVSGVNEFAAGVANMASAVHELGASRGAEAGQENIRSTTLRIEKKRYFLDLRYNNGYYLKIAQVVNRDRSVVTVPEEILDELASSMLAIVAEAGVSVEEEAARAAPSGVMLEVERKTFYFDVLSNDHGTFMKIVEESKTSGRRNVLTIPDSAWSAFAQTFADAVSKK